MQAKATKKKSPRLRPLVELRLLEGVSREKIAEELGATHSQVTRSFNRLVRQRRIDPTSLAATKSGREHMARLAAVVARRKAVDNRRQHVNGSAAVTPSPYVPASVPALIGTSEASAAVLSGHLHGAIRGVIRQECQAIAKQLTQQVEAQNTCRAEQASFPLDYATAMRAAEALHTAARYL